MKYVQRCEKTTNIFQHNCLTNFRQPKGYIRTGIEVMLKDIKRECMKKHFNWLKLKRNNNW